MTGKKLNQESIHGVHDERADATKGAGVLLPALPIFCDLAPDITRKISDDCFLCVRQSQDYIQLVEGNTSWVFFVVSGSIKVSAYPENGREVCFEIVGKEGVIGFDQALVGEREARYYHAREECVLLGLECRKLMALMWQYPPLCQVLMAHLALQARALQRRVYDFSALDTRERTRSLLLKLARPVATSSNVGAITDMPTHEDMANMITSHREAVTKEISALTREGLVEKQDNMVLLPNIRRLKQMIPETV